jgi:hypothetical protein
MSNPTLEALLGRGDDYQPREAWQLAWARREQLEKTRFALSATASAGSCNGDSNQHLMLTE